MTVYSDIARSFVKPFVNIQPNNKHFVFAGLQENRLRVISKQ